MNTNEKKKVTRMHPSVAARFQEIKSDIARVRNENKSLLLEIEYEKKEIERINQQEVHVDDMPGKHLPFRYQINIPFVGGSSAPVTGTFNISHDGPFVCRRLYASVLITDAPLIEFSNGVTTDFTDMIGRYAPVSSRAWYLYPTRLPFALLTPGWLNGWAYPEGSQEIITTSRSIDPPLDFEWEYNDSSGKVVRQDKPISGDILTRKDDDGYLMNNEAFAAGSTVNFIASPTRPIQIITETETTDDETLSGPLDVELEITFDGFKILQPVTL